MPTAAWRAVHFCTGMRRHSAVKMAAMREVYTPGTSESAVSFMARRRAATHAAFFIPYLRAGMRLLDAGCGPGTMTLDLARAVAPATVVGIDQNDSQFAGARASAAVDGLAVRFLAANVARLPTDLGRFDAVFSHALFEHLRDPMEALVGLKAFMNPGAVIGLRSPDWGGFVLHPDDPELRAAITRYEALQTANGGDTRAGRKLAAWLRGAGFTLRARSASYEIYPDARLIADYLARQLDQAGATREAATLRGWAEHPDAMFAQAWIEAVGQA